MTAKNLDPITIEVIGSALSSIVEETGEALIRASYSTNIKERRDCSTALFDAQGRTLCQAEHIPIHLGSFIGIIEHVMKNHPVADMRPGGRFIALEASAIVLPWLHRLYLSYMNICMPLIGWVATGGDASAYRYLLDGVHGFPDAEGLATEMRALGFADVAFERLSLGIVAIHTARRPS